jgi:hypothetical protein
MAGLGGSDINKLVAATRQQYPFVNNTPFAAMYGSPDGNNMMETYPIGETGGPTDPRPRQLPINQAGVEIYNRNAKPSDLAADLLSHSDKYGKTYSKALTYSMDGPQMNELKHEAGDYGETLKELRPDMNVAEKQHVYQRALENAGSAALRADLFDQWGKEGTSGLGYNADQNRLVYDAKQYVHTGKVQEGPKTTPMYEYYSHNWEK